MDTAGKYRWNAVMGQNMSKHKTLYVWWTPQRLVVDDDASPTIILWGFDPPPYHQNISNHGSSERFLCEETWHISDSRLKIQAVFGDLITMYGELRWTSGGPTSHSQTFISNMERQKSCPTFVHENPCFLLFSFNCVCAARDMYVDTLWAKHFFLFF